MVSRSESRRIVDEIRSVLLNVWDPIGVAEIPQCADEYDCCIGGAYSLLSKGASDSAIAEYLWRQANHHMGLGVSLESTKPTVEALRKITLQASST
jgi:hypothetical protein